MRNAPLYEAYKKVTQDVLGLVGQLLNEKKLKVFSFPREVWSAQGGTMFTRKEVDDLQLSLLVDQAEKEIAQLASYKSLVEVFKSDQVLSQHLDQLIGAGPGGATFRTFHAVVVVARTIIVETKDLAFSEKFFEERYANIERDLYATEIPLTRVVPVHGIKLRTDIELHPNIRLVPLSENEISDFLRSGVPIGHAMGEAVFNPASTAMSITKRYPKKFGQDKLDVAEYQTDDFLQGRLEQRALDVLRLYKPGRIGVSGARVSNDSIFAVGIQFQYGTLQNTLYGDSYIVEENDVRPLQELYADIAEAVRYKQRAFGVALRRFSVAGERTSTEDRIIDYLIASEALFLGDGEGQELSYRLSHRAATVLGADPKDKRTLFDKFREAYRLRSQLVHGRQPDVRPDAQGNRISLEQFSDELEDLVRRSIKRKIGIAKAGHTPIDDVDWRDFLF